MDSPSPSRQSAFSTRNSAVDVSQLDKVNAIPNKAADNVLLSNLCQEDQHYLKFLMENDSSASEDEQAPRRSSGGAWSPMVQSPMMNKRKSAKSSYAITLSLEDISYIRPSWGISKGTRTIEVDGKKAKKKKQLEKKSEELAAASGASATKNNNEANAEIAYKYFLLILTLVVVLLTLPPYLAEQKKYNDQVSRDRLRVDVRSRCMEIYRPDHQSASLGEPVLRVNFALGVPANLKPEECTCDVYEAELRKRFAVSSRGSLAGSGVDDDDDNNNNNNNNNNDNNSNCSSCLDWAVRANLRVLVEHRSESDICYSIKWQSYDSLATPLVDCFSVEKSDQWFGLGDIQSADWALNKLHFDWLSLATNLTAESMTLDHGTRHWSTSKLAPEAPSLGSHVNFTLFSTGGIFIGDLRTDFRLSVKVEQIPNDGGDEGGGGGGKRICIKASCNERCSRVWSRADDLADFRHSNNVLEYRICSSASAKSLISSHIAQRVERLDSQVRDQLVGEVLAPPSENSSQLAAAAPTKPHFERLLLERESANWQQQQPTPIPPTERPPLRSSNSSSTSGSGGSSSSSGLPEGIGLIERTIFRTSVEFMPVLDGKTLRQYVDSVVKMGLKTSLILLIDYRWETYIGSLQLNTALFPKWRLLFEIIHNKGFKVMLTVKPFVDTVIGTASVNQLFEAGKLYGTSQGLNRVEQDARVKQTILRRRGLFSIGNETIEIGHNGSTTSRPYVFKCKESQVGYCVLLDLNRGPTRAWLVGLIVHSELLTSNAVDGILMAGIHPDGFSWDDHYRAGLGELIRALFFRERIFALPQWTGDLGYIQLASRPFTWDGLRSVLNSVLNLGLEGFSLIHPGSVWGDLKSNGSTTSSSLPTISTSIISGSAGSGGGGGGGRPQARKPDLFQEDLEAQVRSNEELAIRWLQVSVFLPILQFNNLAPIERYGLQDLLQSLVKIRKLHVIGELKKNLPFTPLISRSGRFNWSSAANAHALIRPVWFNQQQALETPETIVAEQFSVGPDILVAPILGEAIRQRDIYLPNGFWHDELRQINIRGGKWLRNYPVELNEIAWFTRLKRR